MEKTLFDLIDPMPEETDKPVIDVNLAEYPLTFLSPTPTTEKPVLEYIDTINGKDEKPVRRIWRVKPYDEWGNKTTIAVMYDLLQMWRQQGFSDKIYYGSIYHLIQRLGYPAHSANMYKQIRKTLDFLSGLRIDTVDAYYDSEKKAYVTYNNLTLFGYYTEFTKKPKGKKPDDYQDMLPYGYIKIGDIPKFSMEKANLITLPFSRHWFLSLTPLQQRMALYLSKMFLFYDTVYRSVVDLAEQIPLQSNSPKKLKQQIKNSSEALIRNGFDLLKWFEFDKSSGRDVVIFHRAERKKPIPMEYSKYPKYKEEIDIILEDIFKVAGSDNRDGAFWKHVATIMPIEAIYVALAETKEMVLAGDVRNTGGYFTRMIKKQAELRGIKL